MHAHVVESVRVGTHPGGVGPVLADCEIGGGDERGCHGGHGGFLAPLHLEALGGLGGVTGAGDHAQAVDVAGSQEHGRGDEPVVHGHVGHAGAAEAAGGAGALYPRLAVAVGVDYGVVGVECLVVEVVGEGGLDDAAGDDGGRLAGVGEVAPEVGLDGVLVLAQAVAHAEGVGVLEAPDGVGQDLAVAQAGDAVVKLRRGEEAAVEGGGDGLPGHLAYAVLVSQRGGGYARGAVAGEEPGAGGHGQAGVVGQQHGEACLSRGRGGDGHLDG